MLWPQPADRFDQHGDEPDGDAYMKYITPDKSRGGR
jgi:hypothetical protein